MCDSCPWTGVKGCSGTSFATLSGGSAGSQMGRAWAESEFRLLGASFANFVVFFCIQIIMFFCSFDHAFVAPTCQGRYPKSTIKHNGFVHFWKFAVATLIVLF